MNDSWRVKRGWMNLRVTHITEETWDTKTLFFVNEEEGHRAFDYKAGQYLTFRFDTLAAKPLVRSYTMSSSPCEPEAIAVTVKRINQGVASTYLTQGVKVGDVLRARGPMGKFIYDPSKDHKRLVMIAAGSGVTPFVSIMREYQNRLGQLESPEEMVLIVAYRSRKDLILWDFLNSVKDNPKIRVFTTLSREEHADFWFGRVDAQAISKAVNNYYLNTTFMACGPEEMMELAKKHILEFAPSENFKMESFESN